MPSVDKDVEQLERPMGAQNGTATLEVLNRFFKLLCERVKKILKALSVLPIVLKKNPNFVL